MHSKKYVRGTSLSTLDIWCFNISERFQFLYYVNSQLLSAPKIKMKFLPAQQIATYVRVINYLKFSTLQKFTL